MEPDFPRVDLFDEEGSIPYLSDSLGFATVDPPLEDNDFSETVKFINHILMEENVQQNPFYDSLTLQITEKSFYDTLIGNLSPNQHALVLSPEGETTSTTSNNNNSSFLDGNFPSLDSVSVSASAFQFDPHTLSKPPSLNVSHGFSDLDSSIAKLVAQNMFNDADSVSQFKRGLEEATKFLPSCPKLVTGLQSNGEEAINTFVDKSFGWKSRKNHERQERETIEEEGRSSKQSALSLVDEGDISEAIDRVFLSVENVDSEHSSLQSEAVKGEERDGGKGRSKKQVKKKETVDLRNLLLMCAQSVYANDNRGATELLKQIRQHSSPFGDASQRVAHYFANGLEARLVGTGSGAHVLFSFLSSKRITAAEFLKAYQVFLSSTPFKKFTYFFANKMIMEAAEKSETVHIIDFGILYGFQWPTLIKFLSNRKGGPPKLRITGIEFPQPGFRPTEKIEETGHRLANYCKRYKVPFEYHAIASKNWETIQVEALKIESNEIVAVNCHMRFEHLLDESTVEVNSPRNAVLHLIRKINPDIFTQIIINGSYSGPFFTTRFREALFHYSAVYDMFDIVVPRENDWRLMIERELLGREAINVIACEGSDRVQRPETYKQWQVRNTRAGFKQLPLNEELMAKFKTKLKEYHRDFVFDEDNKWMLQGWKGRILNASTCWVPTK